MLVTAVEPLGRNRNRIYLDQQFAFVLYKGELRLFQIAVGKDLSEEDYHKIMAELLPKRAKKRAMNLLMKREYTVSKLREKLKEGEYPEKCIDEAIEYVGAFHYIDDERYAYSYVVDHVDTRSRRRIEQDLCGKGISKDVIQSAFARWQEEGGEQDEASLMQTLLRKRGYDPETASREETMCSARFLVRKGFAWDAVRKALSCEPDQGC